MLFHLARDIDASVRQEVAKRIGTEWLTMLANDAEESVRLIAIRRLPAALLPPFRFDPDWRVRLETAERVPVEYLAALTKDEDEIVAATARNRLNPDMQSENKHGH
jgi:hypothetical protein